MMATANNQIESKKSDPIFCELSANDLEPAITEIESLCMECGKNGTTRMLLTKIPHYKDVIIMSFECEHCGYQNNEIQNGGKIAETGIKITLQVISPQDLNRQVVKSDYTSIYIPNLEFEIPAQSQKGEITTVEGIINRTISALEQDQAERRKLFADTAVEIDKFITKLHALKTLDEPFTIIFEDISGNSYVENPRAPFKDNQCTITYFKRTEEQNHILGTYSDNEDVLLKRIEEGEFLLEEIDGEVISFSTNCPDCNSPCETNMKTTNIPHFKEIVIMATLCESCGHRTNEVKSGGGIEPQGVRIEVTITGKEDFSRDLLKSETFFTGDTSNPEVVNRMNIFIAEMEKVLDGKKKVTLILNDPAGNSYIQSLSDDGPDNKLNIIKYDRSFEQNEELGINDMKVENY
ncbi:zinc finger protein ZPR1 isoform X2 [Pogonomyrmex barbatus]|uniref:Zinc finger protein ZPR1 isoform X2 n=1 Tax=Pogonomyrmex barbatus TaxID=144034 RepID=A0A6I9VZU2_9HYME|nr:zinc finger protein ZPR1 isoform X2 [Pogonomyrmex barbatus]